jgi:hypothetical protein
MHKDIHEEACRGKVLQQQVPRDCPAGEGDRQKSGEQGKAQDRGQAEKSIPRTGEVPTMRGHLFRELVFPAIQHHAPEVLPRMFSGRHRTILRIQYFSTEVDMEINSHKKFWAFIAAFSAGCIAYLEVARRVINYIMDRRRK